MKKLYQRYQVEEGSLYYFELKFKSFQVLQKEIYKYALYIYLFVFFYLFTC